MVVAIHQPNFMPWVPYFYKVAAADVFIVMGHCQFEKNNYQNRFKVEDRWCTMSVDKGLRPIRDKIYLAPEQDWDAIKRKVPAYAEAMNRFDDLVGPSLYDMNYALIERIADLLGCNTRIVPDVPLESTSTQRLVDLCAAHGATTYLSGVSGRKYLDLNLFDQAGIEVVFQDLDSADKVPVLEYLTKERRIA